MPYDFAPIDQTGMRLRSDFGQLMNQAGLQAAAGNRRNALQAAGQLQAGPEYQFQAPVTSPMSMMMYALSRGADPKMVQALAAALGGMNSGTQAGGGAGGQGAGQIPGTLPSFQESLMAGLGAPQQRQTGFSQVEGGPAAYMTSTMGPGGAPQYGIQNAPPGPRPSLQNLMQQRFGVSDPYALDIGHLMQLAAQVMPFNSIAGKQLGDVAGGRAKGREAQAEHERQVELAGLKNSAKPAANPEGMDKLLVNFDNDFTAEWIANPEHIQKDARGNDVKKNGKPVYIKPTDIERQTALYKYMLARGVDLSTLPFKQKQAHISALIDQEIAGEVEAAPSWAAYVKKVKSTIQDPEGQQYALDRGRQLFAQKASSRPAPAPAITQPPPVTPGSGFGPRVPPGMTPELARQLGQAFRGGPAFSGQ